MKRVYKSDRRETQRNGDRRHETRVGASLDAHLVMSAAFLHREMVTDEARNLELYGYIRDLSASGMAIIIPSISFDPFACSEGLPIRLTLEPTKASVEIQVESVYCAPLNLREPLEGTIVGAKLSEQARATITGCLTQSPEA